MEFTILPPEVTSALIHSGPGSESLIQAATAWQQLGRQLEESASAYNSALAPLVGVWQGPSAAAMTESVEPYLAWLRATAQQCQQAASSTEAAVAAFNSVSAAVVPLAQVKANRTRLAQLLATNRFGSNLPAISQTEEQYQTMWANNSAALNRYQTTSAQATTLQQFTSPPEVADTAGTAAQASAVPAAGSSAKSAATAAAAALPAATNPLQQLAQFDPNAGWFGLANTYANQFISSGFPINLLSYAAQNSSAQALQTVGGDIGQGLSEGIGSVGGGAGGGLSALGAAGLSAEPTAAIGVGVSLGKLTAPPAIVGLLPGTQVQLASAATPLPTGDSDFPMPPLMPPPISSGAGTGWRKRKQQKYDDIQIGKELKGTIMPRSPLGG
jgi:PPE-repeat protein